MLVVRPMQRVALARYFSKRSQKSFHFRSLADRCVVEALVQAPVCFASAVDATAATTHQFAAELQAITC
jgi:hypothetical protein